MLLRNADYIHAHVLFHVRMLAQKSVSFSLLVNQLCMLAAQFMQTNTDVAGYSANVACTAASPNVVVGKQFARVFVIYSALPRGQKSSLHPDPQRVQQRPTNCNVHGYLIK